MELVQETTQKNLSSMINTTALLDKLSAADAPKDQMFTLQVTPLTKPDTSMNASTKEHLGRIFEIFRTDVLAARDRLVALNHGRRTLIERRLEFIARKIANKRGERFNRMIALTEVIKESFREEEVKTLTQTAWDGFVYEVALHHMLELFFLKSLHAHGRRPFATTDLGRMNFAAHCFLSQHAAHFSHDKYCWNFVRTGLYSWHVLSNKALEEALQVLEELSKNLHFTWNDQDLMSWMGSCFKQKLPYLEFSKEKETTDFLLDFLETKLMLPLTSRLQNLLLYKKVFIPTLELGTLVTSITDKLLAHLDAADSELHTESVANLALQMQRSIWACETESLELFWTEVLTLLKILAHTHKQNNKNAVYQLSPLLDSKLPQAIHAVPILALELHNLDQLPLGGPELSKVYQGSAGQVQQQETFDVAFVMDNLDRLKSGRWMTALREGLPYWRNLISSSTNLNWGELHLYLAVTKLRETGYCLYFSHRVLPEGGDGDKLRKALLSLSTLEYFIELDGTDHLPYRYLYVFRKNSNKTERDAHRPRFGKIQKQALDLSNLEEANCTQTEIAERGLDYLFVRGALPLVRHLNQKFPKLFQLATIQTWNEKSSASNIQNEMFVHPKDANKTKIHALEIRLGDIGLSFFPNFHVQNSDKSFVFAHNPLDLPWIECLLNSPPVQFWIKHQLLETGTKKLPKLQELRGAPVLDLTHACVETVHDALNWLNQNQHDIDLLKKWAFHSEMSLIERQAKYVALAKRYFSLEQLKQRYQPLFLSGADDVLELKPEAISEFYPEKNLSSISQAPEIRIQYMGKEHSRLLPENWILTQIDYVLNPPHTFITIQTKQGPTIQLQSPLTLYRYLVSQLKALQNHTWGEAVDLLRIPRDTALFTAQTTEITRVFEQTTKQVRDFKKVLAEMSLDLFEIPNESRPFIY